MFITEIAIVDKRGCCHLLLGKQVCIYNVTEIKIFHSNVYIVIWATQNENMICSPEKAEIWLFEVQIRGVGLY